MSKIDAMQVRFVEAIPSVPESGILYVSRKYLTATHLCCCGCGNKVVTPLKPGGWTLTTTGDVVSISPSIGNWSFPCKSHYWIRSNRIVWARVWSQREIDAVRESDRLARAEYFDAPPSKQGFWQRLLKRLFG